MQNKQTIPYGYCQCGCGGKPKISKYNVRRYGYIAGKPRHFIYGHGNKMFHLHSYKINKNGCWIWQGNKSDGYGIIGINGKRCKTHRVMWKKLNGEIPKGYELDHKCRTTLCMNPDHLRLATHHQNSSYRGKQKGKYSSKWIGVSWDKDLKKWRADFRFKKRYFLGSFEKEKDAAEQFDIAAQLFRGEFAILNNPYM